MSRRTRLTPLTRHQNAEARRRSGTKQLRSIPETAAFITCLRLKHGHIPYVKRLGVGKGRSAMASLTRDPIN